jgi:ClpP class serine protease
MISAGRTAEAGYIGVYSVYFDWSGFNERIGIKPIVIRSGEHKGVGLDQITDSQIAVEQEIIDGLADQFISSVAAGRGRDKNEIAELATGRLWLAEEAMSLGLIDAVGNNNINSSTTGDSIMGTENNTIITDAQSQITAATQTARQQTEADDKKRLKDLKTAFPDDLAFAVEQFEAGASLMEAKAAYADVLQEKLKSRDNKGAAPLASGDSADSGENFIAIGKQIARDEKIPLGLAYKKLARERPELHRAYKQSLGL